MERARGEKREHKREEKRRDSDDLFFLLFSLSGLKATTPLLLSSTGSLNASGFFGAQYYRATFTRADGMKTEGQTRRGAE